MDYGFPALAAHLLVFPSFVQPWVKRGGFLLFLPFVSFGLCLSVFAWFGLKLELVPITLVSLAASLNSLKRIIRWRHAPSFRSGAAIKTFSLIGIGFAVFALAVYLSFPVKTLPVASGKYPVGWKEFSFSLSGTESPKPGTLKARLYWPALLESGKSGRAYRDAPPSSVPAVMPLVWIIPPEGGRIVTYEALLVSLASNGVCAVCLESGEPGFPDTWTFLSGAPPVFDNLLSAPAGEGMPEFFRMVETKRLAFDAARKALAAAAAGSGILSGRIDFTNLYAAGIGAGALVLAGLPEGSAGDGFLLLGGRGNSFRAAISVIEGISGPGPDGTWCSLVSGNPAAAAPVTGLNMYALSDELLRAPLASFFAGRDGDPVSEGSGAIVTTVRIFTQW